jgi:hypothetical protein
MADNLGPPVCLGIFELGRDRYHGKDSDGFFIEWIV